MSSNHAIMKRGNPNHAIDWRRVRESVAAVFAGLLFSTASHAAGQPYSLADIVSICHQHERLEQSTNEGSPISKIVQGKGFEHCADLYAWYAKTLNSAEHIAGDRLAVEAMWKMLGPAEKPPEPAHVK